MQRQLIDEVEVDGDYDMTRSSSPESQTIYYTDVARKKLLIERGISL